MIVVSDTSPVTNLAAIGQLDLLQKLYGTITIPLAVYNEMVIVDKVVPGAVEIRTLDWIKTEIVADAQRVKSIQITQEDIDLGEAEAIILALELDANLILMDERRGRAVAVNYGLKVTGLLGVLIQAKHNRLILDIKPLMDQLIKTAAFRISSQLYADALMAAGEKVID